MEIGITGVFGYSLRRDGAFLRAYAQPSEDAGSASLWAPYELEPHLEKLRTILDEHGRGDDPSFQLKLGIPIGDESPDEIAEKAVLAKSLGVQEFVLGPAIRARTMEDDLRTWAEPILFAVS